MWDSIFVDNGRFVKFGASHLLTIFIFIVLGISLVFLGQKLKTRDSKRRLLIYFTAFLFISQILKVFIRLALGNFDITEDLPLHLCNVLPLLLIFPYFFDNRQLWAILFFWVMAGTFQAVFTPTLIEEYPHYEFFRYWIVHCGLVIAALYPIFVLGYRLVFKDIFWSWLCLNIMALLITPFNLFFNANYLYLRAKPIGTTIYDLLGPWPWYILSIEFLIWPLFGLLYLPFYLTRHQVRTGLT